MFWWDILITAFGWTTQLFVQLSREPEWKGLKEARVKMKKNPGKDHTKISKACSTAAWVKSECTSLLLNFIVIYFEKMDHLY